MPKALITEKETNRISGKHKEQDKGMFKKKKRRKEIEQLEVLNKKTEIFKNLKEKL